MNTEIYRKDFAESTKIVDVKVSEEQLNIVIGNEAIEFKSEHSQDCCESVYADFSIVGYHLERLVSKEFTSIVMKPVEDMGFLLIFEGGYKNTEKIFIPCYNYQNGYYSDNLSISIAVLNTEGMNNVTTTVDVSNCVEDHID